MTVLRDGLYTLLAGLALAAAIFGLCAGLHWVMHWWLGVFP